MKISFNWLKELIDFTNSPEEIAALLTSSGVEIASIQKKGVSNNVYIAKIISISKHPNADRLHLCSVDIGKQEPLSIICGAPNCKEGMISLCATHGAVLADNIRVKKTKIRGVHSEGMLCSERELGISSNHEGIISLSNDYTIGAEGSTFLPEDYIFEIELTPNRGDCLSILGIAREISAKLNMPINYPRKVAKENLPDSIDNHITVEIKDSDLCPRYMGRLIKNVIIKDSPLWMQTKLLSMGLRPINNVVDITNYILLLFGQPLHAFDYEYIKGKRIIVQRTGKEMTFTTLDDTERALLADDLLICDAEGPIAIAGVMGGANSEILPTTKHVFLESAYFNPIGTHKTSKRLNLSTDASYRFERGVDPLEGLDAALNTATYLIQKYADGEVMSGVIDVYEQKMVPIEITLRTNQVKRILGIDIPVQQICQYLTALKIECKKNSGDSLTCLVPPFRHDIAIEIDLIEEIGRLYGYDSIETKPYSQVSLFQKPNQKESMYSSLRNLLTASGFHETITNTMCSQKECELLTPQLKPVIIKNPLNPDLQVMRTTLLGSLLRVIEHT